LHTPGDLIDRPGLRIVTMQLPKDRSRRIADSTISPLKPPIYSPVEPHFNFLHPGAGHRETHEKNGAMPLERHVSRTNPGPVGYALVAFASIAFLYCARPVMLPLVGACMIAAGLYPLMRWLSRLGIPTVPSALIIFLILVGATGFALLRMAQPAARWIADAPQHMSDLQARVHQFFPNAERLGLTVTSLTGLAAPNGEKKEARTDIAANGPLDAAASATSILNWMGTTLAQLAEMLVLVFLLLAGGETFTRKVIGLTPNVPERRRNAEICLEMRQNISKYIFSVSVINASLGLAACAGFYLLGLPNAAMWGTVVMLFNFVPYFGPIVGIILLGIVGFLTFDTLSGGLLPSCWYLGLHLVEANVVTPFLIGRRFSLNPVVIFVSLMFWLWLWGVAGALLAVPILVSIKTICSRIPSVASIGQIIGRGHTTSAYRASEPAGLARYY
jgi:predicted PurR-regulated permease PerM